MTTALVRDGERVRPATRVRIDRVDLDPECQRLTWHLRASRNRTATIVKRIIPIRLPKVNGDRPTGNAIGCRKSCRRVQIHVKYVVRRIAAELDLRVGAA